MPSATRAVSGISRPWIGARHHRTPTATATAISPSSVMYRGPALISTNGFPTATVPTRSPKRTSVANPPGTTLVSAATARKNIASTTAGPRSAGCPAMAAPAVQHISAPRAGGAHRDSTNWAKAPEGYRAAVTDSTVLDDHPISNPGRGPVVHSAGPVIAG